MVPWLPRGFTLPGAMLVGKLAADSETNSFQIYQLAGDTGHALFVDPVLAQQWLNAKLLEEGAFHKLTYGDREYYVVVSERRYILERLDAATKPDDPSQGIAFASALRSTREKLTDTALGAAIYLEKFSILLPTYEPAHPITDDVLLGRYLTGGVEISAQASERCLQLLRPRLTPDQLRAVIVAAGLSATSNSAGSQAASEGAGHDAPQSLAEPFRLPGRPALEEFFNDHVVDLVRHAERYRALGITSPDAIVLHGPPGCGKTYAVAAFVKYLGWPAFHLDASSIGSKYIHETSRKVGEIFTRAIEQKPSVVVIDEMEAYLADRETGGDHRVEEVAEFLRRIPEAIENQVLIVGMTNRIDLIDSAILRRGRFSHIIEVGMPSQVEVRRLLDDLLANRAHSASLDLDRLAATFAGRPVSDVAFAVQEAARLTAKAGRQQIDDEAVQQAVASLNRSTSAPKAQKLGFV